jgi:excisionase family DNA binding protein
MTTHSFEKQMSSRPIRVPTKIAAKYLGVSVRTLEDWRAKGKGPTFRKIGYRVRYEISDLDAFLESSKR